MAIFSQLLLFASVFGAAVSSPVVERTSVLDGFDQYVWPKGRAMPVAITKTPAGVLLAWVARDSQGKIATPPPSREVPSFGTPELNLPGVKRGPAGTVPFALVTKKQAAMTPRKVPPPTVPSDIVAAVPHYYGLATNMSRNYGARCIVSRFKPNTSTTSDESLLQIAVVHRNASGYTQTCEVGWQVLGSLHNGTEDPYLFTYFTVNNYSDDDGDDLGCYNTKCRGFVQVSDTYHPGMTFTPYSTIGGGQYSLPVSYVYHAGNWWLFVDGVYVGYYPGSLYKMNGTTTGTLGEFSTQVDFYGETTDHAYPDAPRTDMGSGRYANASFGQAAYIRNMSMQTVEGGPDMEFTGNAYALYPQWYTVDPHFKSGSSFGSYFYVGGPGAG